MKNILPFVFLIIIAYGIYNSYSKKKLNSSHAKTKTLKSDPNNAKTDIGDKNQQTYNYILNVINNGSSKLHFNKYEVMEGGYISTADAPKVACYVMELSGKKCPHPYPKNAKLFYSSVCAGCHGNDGKGVNGKYPNLTREILLGLER